MKLPRAPSTWSEAVGDLHKVCLSGVGGGEVPNVKVRWAPSWKRRVGDSVIKVWGAGSFYLHSRWPPPHWRQVGSLQEDKQRGCWGRRGGQEGAPGSALSCGATCLPPGATCTPTLQGTCFRKWRKLGSVGNGGEKGLAGRPTGNLAIRAGAALAAVASTGAGPWDQVLTVPTAGLDSILGACAPLGPQ